MNSDTFLIGHNEPQNQMWRFAPRPSQQSNADAVRFDYENRPQAFGLINGWWYTVSLRLRFTVFAEAVRVK